MRIIMTFRVEFFRENCYDLLDNLFKDKLVVWVIKNNEYF